MEEPGATSLLKTTSNATVEEVLPDKSPLRKRMDSRTDRSILSNSSPPGLGKTASATDTSATPGDTDDEIFSWTLDHPSIGQRVGASFQDEHDQRKRNKIFFGKVVKFAKESKAGVNDQLYHIEWEDGDEQDYDEDELATAIKCYTKYSVIPAPPPEVVDSKNKTADNGVIRSAQLTPSGAPEAQSAFDLSNQFMYVTNMSTYNIIIYW